jgi:ketosteroid isomerase-like protein
MSEEALNETSAVRSWADAYRRAWESNDPADIRALFTPDAEYRYHPHDEPVSGVEAIVADWLSNRDEPGDTTFEIAAVNADGDIGFVQAVTDYVRKGVVYDNLWVVELAADGRARRFTEWYVKRSPDPGSAAS